MDGGRRDRLSYLNGIGGPQQSLETTETAAATGANRTANTQAASMSAVQQAGAGSLAGTDEAKLSSTAGVMAQALLGSDVRTDKVSALQQSIAAGSYSVPASAVADKLMHALLE